MNSRQQIQKALDRLAFEHRESGFYHHTYDADLYTFELVKRGDLRAINEGKRMFRGPNTGSLSDDPVLNYRYLFVAAITLCSRFCIQGGMPTEESFNLSDIYIRQVDKCSSVEAIFDLHETMIRDYTLRMRNIAMQKEYSRPISRCVALIDERLQQPLTLTFLAQQLNLSVSYLSALFKKETGVSITEYIRRKRIDTAKVLLQYTDFSCLEIAEYLCFSSDCHFSKVFKQQTGLTPNVYRNRVLTASSPFKTVQTKPHQGRA